jgi:hypothetical protein
VQYHHKIEKNTGLDCNEALIRQMTTIILLTHGFDWNSQRKSKHGSKINKKLFPKNFKLLHTSIGQYYNTSNIKID